MKISLQSDQDSLVIYTEGAEVSHYAVKATVIIVFIGLLLFFVGVNILLDGKESKGVILPLVCGSMFLMRGISMVINLPSFLSRIKESNGIILLIVDKGGLSIGQTADEVLWTLYIKEKAYHIWDNIGKISLIRQFAILGARKENFNNITIYLRDNLVEKNKHWLERRIGRKNIEKIFLSKLSEEQRGFIKNELIRLSCQKVKII